MMTIQRKYSYPILKICLCLLALLGPVSNLFSQEMWGTATSNYAGIMGLHLNPASIVGVPYKYEVNILAADIFYDNNYVYLPKLSDLNTTTTTEDGTKTNNTTFVEYDSPRSKHAYAQGLILGPSYIRNKNKSAWAIHSALRAVVSANSVPSALTKAFSTDFDYAPLHSVTFTDMKLNAAGMFLGDIGFTYSRVYMNHEKHWLAWGVTVKGLVAFDGLYLHADVGDYSIPDSSTLNMNHVNLDYGHALTSDGTSAFNVRGFGGSADLGVVYIHKRNQGAYECGKDADRKKRYKYKLSAALIDMGYVAFNRQASRLQIDDGTIRWNGIDTAEFKGIDDVDKELSARSGGASISDRFGMFTPSAASVQFDYCIKKRWYANLGIVQRVPLSHREVYRANSIALVPRYETRKFEASISANMYEYEQVYMGAAVRYLFFVIGSDRLLSFVGNDIRSMDIFFGFKYNSCMLQKKYKNKKSACPING